MPPHPDPTGRHPHYNKVRVADLFAAPVVLPVVRLRRLGATERVITAVREWWGTLSDAERVAIAERWSVTTDGDLDAELSEVDALPSISGGQVVAWTKRQPEPYLASRLALIVERDREQGPRAAVTGKLS